MKVKKIIALGLVSCMIFSHPFYASYSIKPKANFVAAEKEEVQIVSFTTKVIDAEDDLGLSIRIPVIQGLRDINFQQKLNERIEKQAIKDKEDLKQEAREYLEGPKEEIGVPHYELHIEYDVKSSGNILSFTISTSKNLGNNWEDRVDCYNIDLQNNELISLKDLFINESNYQELITTEIQKEIKLQMEEEKGFYFEGEQGFSNISDNQDFYLQGAHIIIPFSKYSIAPGFMGNPEFKIPFSIMKTMLKPEVNKGISFKRNEIISQTDYFIKNIQLPEIQGLADIEFQEKLNKKIGEHLPGLIKGLEKEGREYIKYAEKEGFKAYPYEIHVDYDVKSVGDILSFTVTTFEAKGGTGAPRVDYYNIDTRENRVLDLSSLFLQNKNYKKIIDAEIRKQIKEQMETEAGFYFEGEAGFNGITNDQGFYLQDEYLVICFSKYSIAPGAAGNPEFKIPFSIFTDM